MSAVGRPFNPRVDLPPAVDGWEVLDLSEWRGWAFPKVEFMVDGLIPMDGLVWLGGRPKRGKSLFALYLSCCIAYGREKVAGKFDVLKRPKVLYLTREDSGGRLQQRIADITAAWDEKPTPGKVKVVVRPKFDISKPEHMQWLAAECLEYGIGFVILDTWTALSPGSDPLGAKDQTVLAQSLAQFTQLFEGCVMVIDHTRKNRAEGQSVSSADIMGPSQKWQAAETIIMLADTREPGRLEVYLESKDVVDGRFFLDVSPMGTGSKEKPEKFSWGGSVEAINESRRKKGETNLELVISVAPGKTLPELVEHPALTKIMSRATISRHLKKATGADRLKKDGPTYLEGEAF